MSIANNRDMEELEGALLPLPVATEVVLGSHQNSSVATGIPSAEVVFDYNTALANEQQAREREREEPLAVVVPDNGSQLNYAGVSDDSKSTVGRAHQTGIIRSEEELESIRKAQRKVFSQNYHQKNSVKSANMRAKQRDLEGLQIQSNRIEEQVALSEEKPEAKEPPRQEESQKPQGYQVKEYDCRTYETSTYDVMEYKSVYD